MQPFSEWQANMGSGLFANNQCHALMMDVYSKDASKKTLRFAFRSLRTLSERF